MIVFIALLVLVIALLIYAYQSGPALPPDADSIIEAVLNRDPPNIVRGQTGFATNDGLKIWYERISPEGPSNGTVLLIMAMGGDALIWPPKFVQAFVDAGYHVIRYDHRGTGMSDWVANWDRQNPYSLRDMASDAITVLDALKIEKAHLLGLSMGGMIAQEIAIHHPARAASLTLMMTSGFVVDPDLPGLTSRYLLGYTLKGLPLLKYRLAGGEKNLIKERIAKTIMVMGDEGLDIKEIAEVVLYDIRNRKGINIQATFQHQAAVSISPARYEGLKTLSVPTLVIHGTADQFIPFPHGQKLATTIPNAKSLWLEGVGHVFPPPRMDVWMKAILSHLEDNQTIGVKASSPL